METIKHPNDISILIVWSIVRLLFYIIAECPIFTFLSLGYCIRRLILEREVFHFVHQSQRSVEIVPVRILHSAFDVLVGSAGTPTKFLATAFHPQIVMRTDTCTQGFAQPVGIRTCRNFAHTFGISLFEPHIVTGSHIIIIKSQIPFQLQFLCSIQQIV